MFETGMRLAVLAETTVASMVGSKVRPIAVSTADEFPRIAYQVTDRESIAYLAGTVDDYRVAGFELGIYSNDYDEVMEISELLFEHLDNYGQTIGGVEFAPILFENETDIEQVVPDGEEMPYYLRIQTYRALYKLTGE